jgi:predicted ATP-binding protein involved in virulence
MSESKAKRDRPLQKLISFTDQDLEMIRSELSDGWKVVSLVATGARYVGVIEQINPEDTDTVFIPPRKKIKLVG